MSIKIMTAIFDYYEVGGAEMLVALRMADHANDAGESIFPSVDHLACKTRLSRRAVQYQLRRMQKRGFLLVAANEAGGRAPREYRISPEWLRGANIAPLAGDEGCKPAHRGVQPDARRGAIAIAPKSSLTIKESSRLHANKQQQPAGEGAGASASGQSTLRVMVPALVRQMVADHGKDRTIEMLEAEYPDARAVVAELTAERTSMPQNQPNQETTAS